MRKRQIVIIFFLIVFSILPFHNTFASSSHKEIVKVAITDFPLFMNKDENGNITGYARSEERRVGKEC